MDSNINQQNNHSTELERLLRDKPIWLVRFGLGLFLVLVVGFLIFSWYVKYPEKIQAEVRIVAKNHRKKLLSMRVGRFYLKVSNKDQVKKDQVIGYFENDMVEDLISLSNFLNTYKSSDLKMLADTLKTYENLNEFQGIIQELINSVDEYLSFDYLRKDAIQIKNLSTRILLDKKLLSNKQGKLEISKEVLKVNNEQFEKDSRLFSKKAIPQSEYEESKIRFLNQKMIVENIRSEIIDLNKSISGTESNISQIRIEKSEDSLEFINQIELKIETIKGRLFEWSNINVVKSPCEGKVILNQRWESGKMTDMHEEIGSIIPANENIFAIAFLPEARLGKVSVGQKAILHLKSYPAEEYGSIEATISDLSPVPNEQNQYQAHLSLTNGLTTNLGTVLLFQPELSGNVDIITKEVSLLKRMLYKLRDTKSKAE